MTKFLTTIKIDREVWREAKVLCIRNDITFSDLVNQLLLDKLKEVKK